jgi:predicted 3-demethylubiquinone-9 3-methyltransferase (glyoxalase superfamily)
LTYYSSIFKNSSIERIERYKAEDDDVEGKVMHAMFRLDNYVLMAMESSGQHEFRFNEGISLVVDCDTQQQIDYYWDKLTSDGGQENVCGWLKDRYGVSWQIVPTILPKLLADPSKAERVTNAFMKMKKLEIDKLLLA